MTIRRLRETDEEREADEERKRENIAAGRHPNFISFADADRKRIRDALRIKPSWDDPPDANVFPDPRELSRRKDGFFPPDPNQIPESV